MMKDHAVHRGAPDLHGHRAGVFQLRPRQRQHVLSFRYYKTKRWTTSIRALAVMYITIMCITVMHVTVVHFTLKVIKLPSVDLH